MSDQADVRSIDALKEFRVALALFSEDAMAALGGVSMEARRTVQWVHHDRRAYWTEQIKRRRELVAMAKAEVFRRKLAKTADNTPAMSEQKEILRKAEASLKDAEYRITLVKKWETTLQQAVLEYHGTTRRISSLASGDVPRAMALLGRMIEALEAYLNVSSTTGPAPAPVGSIVESVMAEDEADPTPIGESPVESEPHPPTTGPEEGESHG